MALDHLVVGAGTAGVTVAAALARRGRSVTVVEAGPLTVPRSAGSALDALARPGATWDGPRVQRTAEQGPVAWPRGRGVGGTSAVNGGVLHVPSAAELAAPGVAAWDGDAVHAACTELLDRLGAVPIERAGPVANALDATVASSSPVVVATRPVHSLLDGLTVEVVTGTAATGLVVGGGGGGGARTDAGDVVRAREVIVCAGALGTPALLQSIGIEVPVTGPRDHPALGITLHLREPSPSGTPTFGREALRGDAQLLSLDDLGTAAPGLAMVMVVLVGARSVGRWTGGDPAVDLRCLRDPTDRAAMLAAVRWVAGVAESPEMARVASSASGPDGTPAARIAALDDDALDTWIRRHLGGIHHLSCTAALGAVEQVPGLAVCDASALPVLPRGGTQLTVMAYAEVLAAQRS